MWLPEFCLKLGAAVALTLLCSASPVNLPDASLPDSPQDGDVLAQQAGWVHRQTISKSFTTVTLPNGHPLLHSLDSGLMKTEIGEEGEEDEETSVQIMKGGDDDEGDEVYVMKQPSTPPSSLPSDPYAFYTYQEDLSEDEGFRGGRVKGRRTIIVGDIHGSLVGLDGFLRHVKFNAKRDRLIAAGDIVAKGPQSLEVIDRLASLKAKCVRGNHDDKVLRWKGYLNSLTSQERLDLELDSQSRPLVLDDENSPEYDADVPNVRPRPQKKTIPADLVENSQHHQIAKAMTDAQYKYLVKCPLILTLPKELSVHKRSIHVTHAGIDPRYDINHQKPWVLFNVRNILRDGTPSRKTKKGKGWADLFNHIHRVRSKNVDDDHDDGDDEEEEEGDDFLPRNKYRVNHNYMIVYGHDAKRALNVQDWTVGLDTGCVYGRKLSGYVVETGKIYSVRCPYVAEDDDEE
ncbi:hypothetical protein BGW42_005642 [Actinomortierella wolfii]|nr:hypothetical protein BGW42_005642 [Actinomortierella wolfii]